MQASTNEAYQLLHEGAQAFADIEQHGIHVDVEYCKNIESHLARKIKRIHAQIQQDEVTVKWKEKYRSKTNFGSQDQLADILFTHLGHTPLEFTPTGKPATTQAALEGLKIPFVERYIELGKLKAAKNTFLRNIMRETVEGKLHPFFHLHTVTTYRSSSSNPNFQNFPKRDKTIQRMIRRAIKATPGYQILEVDFKGAEVCISECYHHDPTLREYIVDPARDMHRDSAALCYKLPSDEVTKMTRFAGKSAWVFAQFYGNWYAACGRSLWDYIDELSLKTKSGVPLKEHLVSQNIKSYTSFERHLKEAERVFWEDWFPVYTEWKEKWVKRYNRRGWMKTLTGFYCSGVLKRNEIINYPVQGTSFHCLLWCLTRINEQLHERELKTRIMGQIHDSIVFDLCPQERMEVLGLVKQVIEVDLLAHWNWINVPMSVEAELSPVDGTWYDMEEIAL